MELKCELYRDNFQNFKRYNIPKAQLVIADIPYNIGADAYGSNPMWYNGGDNKNGESKFAKATFFNSDGLYLSLVKLADTINSRAINVEQLVFQSGNFQKWVNYNV